MAESKISKDQKEAVIAKTEKEQSNKTFGKERSQDEFLEKVVQIDRVTRVVKGGRRMRFRAAVVVGDGNGRVGVGISKGNEVPIAIRKASTIAKNNMISINLKKHTIPHEITAKKSGAVVFLKPASQGTGIIAGGAVRAVVEVSGVKDVLSKTLGSTNKINNVYATFEALKALRKLGK